MMTPVVVILLALAGIVLVSSIIAGVLSNPRSR